MNPTLDGRGAFGLLGGLIAISLSCLSCVRAPEGTPLRTPSASPQAPVETGSDEGQGVVEGSGAGPGAGTEGSGRSTGPGGSIGMGLGGITDWSQQRPFIDLVKSARWFIRDVDVRTSDRVRRDEAGWIIENHTGHDPALIFLTNEEGHPLPFERVYRMRWKGKANITPLGLEVVERRPREWILRGNGGALSIADIDPEDHLRDLEIVPLELAELHDRGEIFQPALLDLLGRFRALRFMDWMRTNGSPIDRWADRPTPETWSYMERGVPVEVIIRLANQLDADPWINVPHQASDEDIRSLARLVRRELEPGRIVYVEYSNEVWNFVFPQSQYALSQARELFGREGGSGWVQFGAVRSAQMCDIFKGEVFVEDPERVHCAIGVHSGWPDLALETLDCPWWDEAPCHAHGIDSVAITGYFSGCLHSEEHMKTVRSWFDEPDGGIEKGLEQALDGRHFSCEDTLRDLSDRFAFFAREAKRRGLVMTAYEGGQHITANGHAMQDDERFTRFYVGVNQSEGMGELYRTSFRQWRDAGGTVFFHFVDISAHDKYGSWGALEYLGQPPTPRWRALTDVNAWDCWWEGC